MRKWFGMLLMSMLLMAGCMQVSAAETGVAGAGGESVRFTESRSLRTDGDHGRTGCFLSDDLYNQ